VHDVSCFIPGKTVEVEAIECPAPFVSPFYDSPKSCVKPCPVNAYSDDEYTTMWLAASIPSTFGLGTNIFMASTYAISSKKFYAAVPFQLKFWY
jgi:hypothetical protein